MGGLKEGPPIVGLQAVGGSQWNVADLAPQSSVQTGFMLDGAGFALSMRLNLDSNSTQGRIRLLLDGLELALYDVATLQTSEISSTWLGNSMINGTRFHSVALEYLPALPPPPPVVLASALPLVTTAPLTPQALVLVPEAPMIENPEPGSLALFGAGIAVLAWRWRARRK
jgi:hypothetical protein